MSDGPDTRSRRPGPGEPGRRGRWPVAAVLVTCAALAATSLVMTLVHRAEASHRFSDIATGTFYHDTTAWLADSGIADGYPDGTFRPDADITRGQGSYWFANLDGAFSLESASADLDTPRERFHFWALCGGGRRPLAGGGSTNRADELIITASEGDTNRWRMTWETRDDTATTATVTVWVLCGPPLTP